MEVQNFPSKVVKPISQFYGYYTSAKGRPPERIVLSASQYSALQKAKPVAKALGMLYGDDDGFEFRGVPLVLQ